MKELDVPVALIFFKRLDKTLEVLNQISKVKPKKMYLLGDNGRDCEEKAIVEKLRMSVEEKIDWDCQVIRRYATENIGVYENIVGGAKFVFENEPFAIFLEDDNLPEESFFWFCKDILNKYFDDNRVLWACGTNYLEKYETQDRSSYLFTRNMLPCGWASWGHKFNKFYDGELNLWTDPVVRKNVDLTYINKSLCTQDSNNWTDELSRIAKGHKPSSWDYQMSLSMRANNLLAIVPRVNQIRNIGVDEHSTHGGNSMKFEMTRRFCEIPTSDLLFPLVHPKSMTIEKQFENLIENKILRPFSQRLLGKVERNVKQLFHLHIDESIRGSVKSKLNNILKRWF